MNNTIYFDKLHKFINLKDYKHIISIGNKCPTAVCLRSLGVYKESYPFDYIPTLPFLVLKYIKNNVSFLPQKNKIRNLDNVWFGHFNLKSTNYNKIVKTFNRRFDRLHNVIRGTDKFLLVYTSESDVYNEMNSFYKDNYLDLLKIKNYILSINPKSDFKILAIHTNKGILDSPHIINFTMNVDKVHLSLNGSTHTHDNTQLYRNVLLEYFKYIFKI